MNKKGFEEALKKIEEEATERECGEMDGNDIEKFILLAINELMSIFYRRITKNDLIIFISAPTLMKLVKAYPIKANPKLENWGYISFFGVDIKEVYDDGDFIAVGLKPEGFAKISAAIGALLNPQKKKWGQK